MPEDGPDPARFPKALAWAEGLAPADVPPHLNPGERIADPARYLASLRRRLSDRLPAALHDAERLAKAIKAAPAHEPETERA